MSNRRPFFYLYSPTLIPHCQKKTEENPCAESSSVPFYLSGKECRAVISEFDQKIPGVMPNQLNQVATQIINMTQ